MRIIRPLLKVLLSKEFRQIVAELIIAERDGCTSEDLLYGISCAVNRHARKVGR